MAQLKDIQRRIASVGKTQQITRAMRMVAGAKLRRAESAIVAARPYADRMLRTVGELAGGGLESSHPLLDPHHGVHKVEVIVVTSDRGLCGAFNVTACKRADAVIAEYESDGVRCSITTAGRKATEYYQRRRPSQIEDRHEHGGWVTLGQAAAISSAAAARFESGEVDEVALVYNEFVSTMTQRPKQQKLIPFTPEASGEEALPYTVEPDADKILETLVPQAVEVEVYRALLENQAGEHAARMSAMESATRNTQELIESLTLQFNRARQAAITKELVEIVSGAEAL